MSLFAYSPRYTWGCFLQRGRRLSQGPSTYHPPAFLHVKLRINQSKTCVENEISATDQLIYTRELHKVAPLWVEARRRIGTAKDAAQQMSVHPFFIAAQAQHSIKSYLQKTMGALEDQVSRTHELTDETNILISLVGEPWLAST
jgi:hypothetical protein